MNNSYKERKKKFKPSEEWQSNLLTTNFVEPEAEVYSRKHSIPPYLKRKKLALSEEVFRFLGLDLADTPFAPNIIDEVKKLKKRDYSESYYNLALLSSVEENVFNRKHSIPPKLKRTKTLITNDSALNLALNQTYTLRLALIDTKATKKQKTQVEELNNLLTTTLSQAPAAPFVLGELEKLLKSKKKITTQEIANILLTTLPGSRDFPFNPIEEVKLKQKKRNSEEQNNPLVNLLTQPQANPFNSTEDYKIRNKKVKLSLDEVNSTLTTLPTSRNYPFNPIEELDPKRKKRKSEELNNPLINLLTVVQPDPFNATEDYRLKPKKAKLSLDQVNPTLTTLPGSRNVPFNVQELDFLTRLSKVKPSEELAVYIANFPVVNPPAIAEQVRLKLNKKFRKQQELSNFTINIPAPENPPISANDTDRLRKRKRLKFDVNVQRKVLENSLTNLAQPEQNIFRSNFLAKAKFRRQLLCRIYLLSLLLLKQLKQN